MKTLILGASPKAEKYSYKATAMLKAHHHEAIPLGIQKGEIEGIAIETELKPFSDIDTVTLYVNPERQKEYESYILSLKPRRIIANPGTENSAMQELAEDHGIIYEEACTLVLLSTDQY